MKKLGFIALASLISSSVFANSAFFEVGKSYLFIPRLNLVAKGTVTQVTDHEIVFTDRYILKATLKDANETDDGKSAKSKSAAIAEYLKSDNKAALLEEGPLTHVPTSYSRAALTAIRLD